SLPPARFVRAFCRVLRSPSAIGADDKATNRAIGDRCRSDRAEQKSRYLSRQILLSIPSTRSYLVKPERELDSNNAASPPARSAPIRPARDGLIDGTTFRRLRHANREVESSLQTAVIVFVLCA